MPGHDLRIEHTSCWKRLKISKTSADKGTFEKKLMKARVDLFYFKQNNRSSIMIKKFFLQQTNQLLIC